MKRTYYFLMILCMAVLVTACNGKPKEGEDGPDTNKQEKSVGVVEPISCVKSEKNPSKVYVYIDNSGSMKGYVEGNNQVFVDAISSLQSLTASETFFWGENSPVSNSMNLAGVLAKHKFRGEDTPFPQILSRLAAEASSGALSFFVTDGIVSPKDADEHFKYSKGAIKNIVKDSLKNKKDIAVAVFRMTSGYSNKTGYYYDYKNTPIKLTNVSQRPFFVITIGKRDQVQWLVNQIGENKSLESYKKAKKVTFGLHKHNPNLLFADRAKFNSCGNGELMLKSISGGFSLSADLPECLKQDLGLDYIGKHLSVKLNGEDNPLLIKSVGEKGITIACEDVKKLRVNNNTISVTLAVMIPKEWYDYSSDDDSNIKNDIAQQGKTFFLDAWLAGVSEAVDREKFLINSEIKFKKK